MYYLMRYRKYNPKENLNVCIDEEGKERYGVADYECPACETQRFEGSFNTDNWPNPTKPTSPIEDLMDQKYE
jgi:hypothetical protein